MTQATAPASPPARSVADLRARFVDVADTTAVVVVSQEPPSFTMVQQWLMLVGYVVCVYWTGRLVTRAALYAFAWSRDFLSDLFDSALLWCADTYTTLRARRGRT